MFSILLAYDFCRIRLWLACACHMLRIHGTWEGHRKRLTFYRGQRSGLDGELVACWKLREKKTMGKPFFFMAYQWLIMVYQGAYHGLSWFIRAYLGLSLWDIVSEIYCEILWMGVCSSFSHTHVFPSSSKLVSSAKVSVHSLTDLTAGLWTTLDHFFLNQRYSRCTDDYRHKYKQRSSLQNSPNINATALKTLV